jgi:acyl-CoA reductase-like NAD-dependent aldehyde dehydrogenase
MPKPKTRATSIDFEDLDPDLQEIAAQLRASLVEEIDDATKNPQERIAMLRDIMERLEERIEEYEDIG